MASKDSMLRQWNMLRLVPRAPQSITAADITERLAQAEFPVDKRTVERDLNALAGLFPLQVDDSSKPFRWSWQRAGAAFSLPGMSVPEALTLTMVEQHLRHQLPPSTLDALQPHFSAAAHTLAATDDKAHTKAWLGKVRSIPAAQPLLPAELDEGCQRTIYDALMKDCQLKLHYLKRDGSTLAVYESVHPLAIVQKAGTVYMVCLFADYDDARTIALHRVKQAELLHLPARRPAGFDIDAFIAQGQFGIAAGGAIRLQAVFKRAAGEHLAETPLSKDQVLYNESPDTLRLIATVPRTRALSWWLLGFGDGVVVHEPAELREELKQTALRMAAAYGGDGGSA